MACDTYVIGVGLSPFTRPSPSSSYPALALTAGTLALLDAGLTYTTITHAIACYCYGDSTSGQRCFYQFGMTGIPIYNVNNNCSTGSTGLHLARTLISSGAASCIMVLGFEKMAPGSLKAHWADRENPTGRFGEMMALTRGVTDAPLAAQLFGNAGREYMERHGATAADFAEIARVNHAHSTHNPYSQFRTEYTLAQIEAAPAVFAPLTKLQCCPTSDGAAAAVLCSAAFLAAHPRLRAQAVRIAGQAMTTDAPATFSRSALDLVGFDMSARAARAAYAEAGIADPKRDVALVELHDCFSANEMVTLDALGLCAPGTAHEMVRGGDITYGGRVLVNPSGGLISKGHPLGATGLAQCAELVWHLRGWANTRLREGGVGRAVQHNLGLGGACVVTVYERADGGVGERVADEEVGGGVGWNPATRVGEVTEEMTRRVRGGAFSEWAISGAGEREAKL